MQKHKVFCDTNVLLSDNFNLNDYKKVYISIVSIEEIDGLKHDNTIGYQARRITNKLKSAKNVEYVLYKQGDLINLEEHKNDNKILQMAYDTWQNDTEVLFLTDDFNLKIKADAIKLPCELFEFKSDEIYTGYKEVTLSDFEIASFYECQANKWNIKQNEYILIKNEDGEIIDKLKWTSKGFKALSYKTVDSRYVGKVKPRNLNQELYMDMLQDKESKVKIVQGGYGTGKDYLALANFLNMVEKGQYDKIIWIRNNIEAEGSKPIGYLPGSLTEKLSVYADIVGDFVGDKVGFEMLLNSGKLELAHTGFLRGRDLRNSIIYCTEAQNMSSALVKLILSRISDGSIAFFNGDIKQVDEHNFKMNNGLSTLINKLKGNPLFGYVYLNKCERSEVANLVSLMD